MIGRCGIGLYDLMLLRLNFGVCMDLCRWHSSKLTTWPGTSGAAINNRPLLPFRYQHLGDMMSLGAHTLSQWHSCAFVLALL